MRPRHSPHNILAPRMPRRRVALLSIVMLLLTTPTAPALARMQTPDEIADQVIDSTVTVYTWTEGGTFSPGRTGREPSGAGSGWVFADGGIVVTNNHVVDGADEIEVVTADGAIIPAEVAGADWYHDVAVLRLQPEDGQQLPPAAAVGDSSAVGAGDAVIAIGTPHGQFADTVTVGHVTSTGVSLNTGAGYSLTHLIQHDAAIAPGNSGGPLVSMDGEVIGMNVARADIPATDQRGASGASFAIDSNTTVAMAEEILATGSVGHPYLGVQTRVTADGVTLVTGVEPGSPAAEAGIEPGDVLVAVAGERVDANHPFIDLLYTYDPGDALTLTIARDGDEEADVLVTLGGRAPGVQG